MSDVKGLHVYALPYVFFKFVKLSEVVVVVFSFILFLLGECIAIVDYYTVIIVIDTSGIKSLKINAFNFDYE